MARLSLFFLVALTGCGVCRQIEKHRADFAVVESQAKSNGKPQVRVDVPTALVNRWLNDALSRLPPVSVRFGELARLEQILGALKVKARRITSEIKPGKDARFDVDLDVFMNRRIVFGLRFTVTAPVKVDPAKGTIEVALRGDSFSKIRPRLTTNAKTNLTSNLMRMMPALLRPIFSRSQVESLVAKSIEAFGREAAKVLTQKILRPMGVFTRLRLQVPDLPIDRVVLEADKARWSFSIYSTLAGPGIGPMPRRGKQESVQVGFGADFVARLANWSMANGKLPARYGGNGKPDPKGPFTVGVSWAPGERPLNLDVWRTRSSGDSSCMRARVSAGLRPKIQGRVLELNLVDGQVEEVSGSLGATVPLTFMQISGSSFDISRRVSAATRLRVGGLPLELVAQKVTMSNEALIFQLSANRPGKKTAAKR